MRVAELGKRLLVHAQRLIREVGKLKSQRQVRPHCASAYVSIRQYTSAYVRFAHSARQHTSAYDSIRQHTQGSPTLRVSIRQHTTAYVSIRQVGPHCTGELCCPTAASSPRVKLSIQPLLRLLYGGSIRRAYSGSIKALFRPY